MVPVPPVLSIHSPLLVTSRFCRVALEAVFSPFHLFSANALLIKALDIALITSLYGIFLRSKMKL